MARSLGEAVQLVSEGGELADKVESVHIIGGSSVYKVIDFFKLCI